MDDPPPEYSILELVLSGLFIAMAASFFIFAAHQFLIDRAYDAMESAGVGLMILDACTDPKRYFATWAAFLVRPVESAGRETLVTLAGGVIGSLLLFAGWLLNWRAEHIG